MTTRPAEATEVRNRLLKCGLEAEDSRVYWRLARDGKLIDARRAFDEYLFGARSLSRLSELITNMRARFDAYPSCIGVLGSWAEMRPQTRTTICHWHVQLAEPLYRRFSGEFLVDRRVSARPEIRRDGVVSWIETQLPERWSMTTKVRLATSLLSAAYAAGLVGSTRDPRPLTTPHVSDAALEYLVYLLRGVVFDGSLLENPYLASVGLSGRDLERRLSGLAGLAFRRQGDLIDFGWQFDDLAAWGRANLEAVSGSAP